MQSYSCNDGTQHAVQCVNTGANTLAIVPVDGQDRMVVAVVSASGAQYVSGVHVWWSKGDTATLKNTLETTEIEECQVRGAAAPE
ncbi:MliC family protein [Aliiroseovarius sediminis]|uniref:MliC family protein n=1 Tax=Aliiroseovarius sediminis TaxID=2925839 RepID=UPI0025979D53|nr:MliC family protein [uncultured Aliiroseovarius sp.]